MKKAQMKIHYQRSAQDPRTKTSQPPEFTVRPAHLLTLLLALCSYFTSSNLSATSFAAADSIFRFQSKMAERGHIASQYALAYMYESGQGTSKDLKLATEWYQRTAQQGFSPAKDRLVYIDMLDKGYQPQQQQQWLLKLKQTADDYNHKHQGESAFLLGQLYAAGLAVNKSLTMSLKYLRLAEAANVIGSDSEIRRVEAELNALRKPYASPDKSTPPSTQQTDKPANDNKTSSKLKQQPAIDRPGPLQANKTITKQNRHATSNRAEAVSPPAAHRLNAAKYNRTASTTTVSHTQTRASSTGAQAAPHTEQSHKQEQQEPHPMQVICSGWQRMNSACR